MRNISKHKINGFTLIELLVVVLIIGILASIALPQYTKAVKKAHVAKMLPVFRSLADAERVYRLNGETSYSLIDLGIDIPKLTLPGYELISVDFASSQGSEPLSTDPEEGMYAVWRFDKESGGYLFFGVSARKDEAPAIFCISLENPSENCADYGFTVPDELNNYCAQTSPCGPAYRMK